MKHQNSVTDMVPLSQQVYLKLSEDKSKKTMTQIAESKERDREKTRWIARSLAASRPLGRRPDARAHPQADSAPHTGGGLCPQGAEMPTVCTSQATVLSFCHLEELTAYEPASLPLSNNCLYGHCQITGPLDISQVKTTANML